MRVIFTRKRTKKSGAAYLPLFPQHSGLHGSRKITASRQAVTQIPEPAKASPGIPSQKLTGGSEMKSGLRARAGSKFPEQFCCIRNFVDDKDRESNIDLPVIYG